MRGQPAGAGRVGHHHADACRAAPSWWWSLPEAVLGAWSWWSTAVVVVVDATPEPSWWCSPPSWVVGVVVGVVLTLGRVPTATRTATATTKTTRTAAARTSESAPDDPRLRLLGLHQRPACRAPRPMQAFPLVAPGRAGGGPVVLAPRPSSSVGRALHL